MEDYMNQAMALLKEKISCMDFTPEQYSWHLNQLLEENLLSQEEFEKLAVNEEGELKILSPDQLVSWIGHNLVAFHYNDLKLNSIIGDSTFMRKLSRTVSSGLKNAKIPRKRITQILTLLLGTAAQTFSGLMGENMLDTSIRDEMFFSVLNNDEVTGFICAFFSGPASDPNLVAQENTEEIDTLFNTSVVKLSDYLYYRALGGQESFDADLLKRMSETDQKKLADDLDSRMESYNAWNKALKYSEAFNTLSS